jgi:catechol 2,3-dioxygenase-like lactoylglutathione lyase family enzyme
VRHIKRERGRTWIEVDTSEAFLPDVLIEHDRFAVVPAVTTSAEPVTADLVGISCGFDVLAADERIAAEPGDVLAFLGTGAYQDAASSNFNALPRPATVLVRGGEAELVKRRETAAEVFARDLVPARLAAAAPVARGVDHVSVTVGSIDRSLAFYEGLLGLSVRERSESDDPELAEITGVPGVRMAFADLVLGDGRVLELVEYLQPRLEPLGQSVQRPGSGHVSLLVDDAGAVHRRLTEAGVVPRSPPVLIEDDGDWHGVRCFYAEDPDGFTLEFIQRPQGLSGEGD